MKVRMTAAGCAAAAALLAVPAAFADHGSGGDDGITVATTTTSSSEDTSSSTDDSTDVPSGGDATLHPEQETGSTGNETEDVQLQPAAGASFTAVLRHRGSGRNQPPSTSRHRHGKH